MLKNANLALAFLVELAGLVAFAYAGAHVVSHAGLRIALAVFAPVIAVLIWGAYCAPKARIVLPETSVSIIKLAMLTLAVLGLVAAHEPWWGLVLAVVALANAAAVPILDRSDSPSS